jgi:hypothetical protein
VGSGAPGATSGSQIQVYPAGATSTTAAVRTITGTPNNPLPQPWAITVDASGQVYVLTTQGTVQVYAAGATGPVAPVKTIAGSSTLILTPLDIAVDSAQNIYVAFATAGTTGEIAVFSSSQSGNVTPVRTITSNNLFFSIAVDSNMNIWTAINTIGVTSTTIAEYSANASGAATATKTIVGVAPTTGAGVNFSAVYASGLRLDAAGNIWMSLYTPITSGNNRGNSIIEGFGSSVSGNVYPGASFSNTSVWSAGGTEIAVK